jgi:exosortase/archaeosortase family protein
MAKKKKKNLRLRKKLKTVAWFLIKFNLLAIPLYLVLYFNFSFPPLQEFLTKISIPAIELFGYKTMLLTSFHCNVDSIFIPAYEQSICISWDSTGWKSMYALAALAIATPFIAWKRKWKFIAVGVPLVFALNYIRIVTTILISLKFGFQYFNVVHTLLWREGLILAVVAIWYLWLRKEKYNIR